MTNDIPGIFSKEMEIFITLAQTRSFRQTSEMFHLSSGSVSRLIGNLETNLGVTLFDRSHKPMTLTAEGRWLLNELKPSLRRIAQTVESLKKTHYLKPMLRIGFIDSFSYDVAPQFIRAMAGHVQHISCLTGGADRLVERLSAQEVDVILTINPCFDIPNLRRHLLVCEPSVLIFPPQFLAKDRQFTSWQELSVCGLPFIRNYSFSGGGKLETVHFTTNDLKITSIIHTDNIGMRLKLVSEGMGWAIIRPMSLLQHMDLVPYLHIVTAPEPWITRKIYVLARPSISRELFIEIISSLTQILKGNIVPKLQKLVPEKVGRSIQIYDCDEHL